MRLRNHVSKCFRAVEGWDLHDGSTDDENSLPLIPVQWEDREKSLQHWSVEQSKVQRHGQSNGIHQHHVIP